MTHIIREKKFIIILLLQILIFSSCRIRNVKKFFIACATDDITTCKTIIEKNPDIVKTIYDKFQPWLENNYPQFYPSSKNSPIQWLTNNANSRKPLRIAVMCNSLNVLEYLTERGNFIENDFNSAFSLAVENNREEAAKIFLQNGANPNSIMYADDYKDISILNYSIKKNFNSLSILLIESGADVNAIVEHVEDKNSFSTKEYNYNETPLHSAATRGQDEIVKLLLEKGANVNAKDYNGETPLMWAAELEKYSTIEILLENGADINSCDNNGCTALIKASMVSYGGDESFVLKEKYTDARIVKFLLQHKANKNIRDNNKHTVLEYAVLNKNSPVIEVLLGLDSYEEWTPLKIDLMGMDNIGKKICIRNGQIIYIYEGRLVNLNSNDESIAATFERNDPQLGISIAEKILSLKQQYNENPRNGNADFFGYIEPYGTTGQYTSFHITHILER